MVLTDLQTKTPRKNSKLALYSAPHPAIGSLSVGMLYGKELYRRQNFSQKQEEQHGKTRNQYL
jgi:hypothetical protein